MTMRFPKTQDARDTHATRSGHSHTHHTPHTTTGSSLTAIVHAKYMYNSVRVNPNTIR